MNILLISAFFAILSADDGNGITTTKNNYQNDEYLASKTDIFRTDDNYCPDDSEGTKIDENTCNRLFRSEVIISCDQKLTNLYMQNCIILFYRCTFKSIISTLSGGAIYLFLQRDEIPINKKSIVESCNFTQCSTSGPQGGSIYINGNIYNFDLNIINCIFEESRASQYGGALYLESVNGNVENCTFKNNKTGDGGVDGYDLSLEYSLDFKDKCSLTIKHNSFIHEFRQTEENKSTMLVFSNYANIDFSFIDNIINIFNPYDGFAVFGANINPLNFDNYQFSNNCLNLDDEKYITNSKFLDILQTNFQEYFKSVCEPASSLESESEYQTEQLPSDNPFDTSNIICLVTYDNENISITDHCYYSSKAEKNINVRIISSIFSNFKNESHGSVAFITNCQVEAYHANFTNCVSLKGGGGAIYIKNSKHLINHIIFKYLQFTNCKAYFGGAIYIFSKDDESHINISFCNFLMNEATVQSSINGNIYFGGDAIFFTAKNINVKKCIFENNIGSCACKIYNKFNDNEEENKNQMLCANKESIVSIIKCDFKISDKIENAIFLANSRERTTIFIEKCNFKGKFTNISHYIDTSITRKELFDIQIHSCNFDYGLNGEFNPSLLFMNNFVNKKIAFLLGCILTMVFPGILIFIKKLKYNSFNEKDDFSDTSEL